MLNSTCSNKMRINLNYLIEPGWKELRYPNMLHMNPVWPVTDWRPFGRITVDVRASGGTRNKMCHFPP